VTFFLFFKIKLEVTRTQNWWWWWLGG